MDCSSPVIAQQPATLLETDGLVCHNDNRPSFRVRLGECVGGDFSLGLSGRTSEGFPLFSYNGNININVITIMRCGPSRPH